MTTKHRNKQVKLGLLFAAGFAGVASILLIITHASGTATLSLSPASGSHDINTNFTVKVYENSGTEQVNAVQADLIYDQSKLQFVSVTNTGSPFNTCVHSSGGSGSVSTSCALLGSSVTGSQLVSNITFKALVGSGSSSVNFASSSSVVRYSDATDIWDGNTSGGTYSFTTPAAPTPPATTPPSSSSSSHTTPSSSTTTSSSSSTPSPTTNQVVVPEQGASDQVQQLAATPEPSKKQNLTPWYLGVGGALFILIAGLGFWRWRIKRNPFKHLSSNTSQPQTVQPNSQSPLPASQVIHPTDLSGKTVAEIEEEIKKPDLPRS